MSKKTDCPQCGQNLELPADATEEFQEAERVRLSWVDRSYKLESENKRLREALEKIARSQCTSLHPPHIECNGEIAKSVLEDKK